MNLRAAISIYFVLLLTGCASGYGITYNTQPTGASIICTGTNYGYSPVTLNYQPDENNKKTGTMRTEPCTAIWSSGYSQKFSTNWDLNQFPKGVMQTLQRPQGDGYSQDAQFALSVQSMQAQQAAAKAQQDAANAAIYNAINQNKPKTTYTNCGTTYGSVNCTSTTY